MEETKDALIDKEKKPIRKESTNSRNRKRRGSSRSQKGTRARVYTESKSNMNGSRRNTRENINNNQAFHPMKKIYSASAYTSASEMNDDVIKSEYEHEYETSVVIKEESEDDPEIENSDSDNQEIMRLKVDGNNNNNDENIDRNKGIHLSTSFKITEEEIDDLMDHVDQIEYNVSDMSEKP